MSDTETSSLPLEKPRVQWVDYAKGLSIFLVVVYHVWNGIMKRADQIPSPADWYDPINRTFEMVRMPLFFFVSGLFVGRSAQKHAGKFVLDKLQAIVWPYVIWSCVHVVVTVLLARVSRSTPEVTIGNLPYYLAIAPVAQFWFLYVLFLALMLFLLLVKLRVPTWGIAVIGVGMILVKLNVPLDRLSGWGPFFQLLNFFIYMALGAILAPVLLKRVDEQKSALLGAIAVVTGVAVWFVVWYFKMKRDLAVNLDLVDLNFPIGLLPAMASVTCAICVAVLLQRAGFAGFVRTMGRFSLYIFVMHVIFAAGLRAVLLKAGVHSFAAHMLIGIPFAVLAPIGVAIVAKQFGLNRLFTLHSR